MRTGSTATATPATSEKTPEYIVAENISELAEDIIHVHTAAVESTPAVIYSRMSVAIVLGTLIRVTQNLICFSSFLKFFFSRFISRIAIGMILHRYFPVGLFYFICGSRPGNAQYFVIISFHSDFSYFPTITFAKRIILSFK